MSTVVNLGALGAGGFVIQGDNSLDGAGFSVSGAGDLNGDGIGDFIVGAPYNDSAGTNNGAAYVIYGRAGGLANIDLTNLSPNDGFKMDGAATSFSGQDLTGLSVSSAGDVNGDGFGDFIIAADRTGAFGYGDGPRAYVVFGGPARTATLDLTALTSNDGFQINGPFEFAYYKSVAVHVSSAGDINGDGFDDILVGLPYAASGAGATYVVFGKADGFATINLGNAATADYFAVTGATSGASVASLGDINNDGFDDFIIGAPYSNVAGTKSGGAYVIFGHAGNFSNIDLNNLAPSQGFAIQGDAAGDFAGFSVSAAGDVNGDGINDIIIGSLWGGSNDQGAAYVIFGQTGGFGTIDLTNLPSSEGFVIQGAATGDIAGRSVSAAGDVNHDGFADLIVAAPGNGASEAGAAYVIFGHPGIGSINLGDLAPVAGFIIQGAAANDFAGDSVSGAGDVNGDGFDDVIVGDTQSSLGGDHSGAAYVVYGAPTVSRHIPHTDFNGDARADILWRNDDGRITDWTANANGSFTGSTTFSTTVPTSWHVAGTSDFNGDARADILWRNDNGTITDWTSNSNGTFSASTTFSVTVPTSWQVAGVGDFNGDGRGDILWRNDNGTITDWLANSSGSFDASTTFSTAVVNSWHVVGTADFNGDGRDDILWRNDNGQLTDWLATANGTFAANTFSVSVPTNWTVAATGDFNGDSYSDILWRSDTGQLTDWLGSSTGALSNNAAASTVVPTSWQVVETGDFNLDGRDDILWRNSSGTLTEWLGTSSGTFIDHSPTAAVVAPSSWHVQDAHAHGLFS